MTDRRRRREGEKPKPPLSDRAKIYLDLAAERVAAADLHEVGSPAAVSLAQEAIGYTAFAVSRHLEAAYPTTDMPEREQWLSVLRFLSGTLMFQQPLETLTLALTELDRGLVPEGLERKPGGAQGGAPTERKLMWMRMAVEVADEFVRQHGGHQADAEDFMDELEGVSSSTIRKWRKTLSRLAPEHRPRSFRRWMPSEPSPAEIQSYAVSEGLSEPDDGDCIHDPEVVHRARLAPLCKALQTFCERAKKDIS